MRLTCLKGQGPDWQRERCEKRLKFSLVLWMEEWGLN